jgi:4-hydroxy-tetrahydrodipicolinate synthase
MSSVFRSSDLAGVHVALFTPLLRDSAKDGLRNGLDYEKAAGMIEDLLEAGIDGIVPIGTTGQSPTVTTEEHLAFVKFTIERVAGRAKVIAGAGSNSTRESVDMIRAIQEIAPGTPCLCVTGYYNNPPQEGIAAHYEILAEETGAPIVVYNVPGRTASYIEPETVIRLAAHPGIVGLKQSVNFADPGRFRDDTLRIARETARTDFALVSGEDSWFADMLELGGVGLISASANIPEAAKLFLEIRRRFLSGDAAGARAVQAAVDRFVKWVFCRKSPIPLATFFDSPVFLPLVDLVRTEGGEKAAAELKAFARAEAPSVVRWWKD